MKSASEYEEYKLCGAGQPHNHSVCYIFSPSQSAASLQNPALFSGTVRYNLDPFNDYTDDSILWRVLEQVSLQF